MKTFAGGENSDGVVISSPGGSASCRMFKKFSSDDVEENHVKIILKCEDGSVEEKMIGLVNGNMFLERESITCDHFIISEGAFSPAISRKRAKIFVETANVCQLFHSLTQIADMVFCAATTLWSKRSIFQKNVMMTKS